MTDQHEHEWGPAGACGHCAARKCKKWRCADPRGMGAAVCARHLNGRSEVVPQARTVRVTTYAWPGRPAGELNDGERAALVLP